MPAASAISWSEVRRPEEAINEAAASRISLRRVPSVYEPPTPARLALVFSRSDFNVVVTDPVEEALQRGHRVSPRSRSRPEQHRQRRRGPEHPTADVRIVALRVETQVGQAVEQELERDAHLNTGQVHAEAYVRPDAEADVGLRRAEDVEAVRILPA